MITFQSITGQPFAEYNAASQAALAADKPLAALLRRYNAAQDRHGRLDKQDTKRRTRRYDLQRRLHRMAGCDWSVTQKTEQAIAALNVLIAAGEVKLRAAKADRSALGDQYFAHRKTTLAAAGLAESWEFKVVVS
jgi:hypothetical protein